MAETVAPGTNRYLCPLECGWHYDQPPFDMADTAGITPDPSAATPTAAVSSVVEQAALRQADIVESAVREHVATHGIHTVDELRAAIPASVVPDQKSGVSYCSPVPVVSLDRFEGADYVTLEAPQLLDSVLLTPEQARVLAAVLAAHADTLDPPA